MYVHSGSKYELCRVDFKLHIYGTSIIITHGPVPKVFQDYYRFNCLALVGHRQQNRNSILFENCRDVSSTVITIPELIVVGCSKYIGAGFVHERRNMKSVQRQSEN